MIIGFDLGRETGYATSMPCIGNLKAGANALQAGCGLLAHLPAILGKATKVYYERVYTGATGIAAIQAFGGYHLAIEYTCRIMGIPCVGIETGKWKKDTIGNGNATKAQVRAAVENALGIKTLTQDECDAVCVLCSGMGITLDEYAQKFLEAS